MIQFKIGERTCVGTMDDVSYRSLQSSERLIDGIPN